MATTKKTATKKVAKKTTTKAVKKTAAPAKKPKAPAKPRAPRKPRKPQDISELRLTAPVEDVQVPPHATAQFSADELAAAVDPTPVAVDGDQVVFSDGTRTQYVPETPAVEGVWSRFKRWLKS